MTLTAKLPIELIDEIISYYICDAYPTVDEDSLSTATTLKPDWRLIEPLTLTSRSIRQSAVEAWFQVFVASHPRDLVEIDTFPQVGSWIRILHCKDHDRTLHDAEAGPWWDLSKFKRVNKLRLDVDPFDYNYAFDFCNVPPLQELEVHDHPWPSPVFLQAIATRFPELRVLRLSQKSIWCSLCNTCNFPAFKEEPPSPIVYTGGIGLPMHYNRFWAMLKHLHTVRITVGYHKNGYSRIDEANENLWCGECDHCMAVMYADEGFRVDWVERKKSAQLRPPALQRVEWRFVYVEVSVEPVVAMLEAVYDSEEEDEEDEEE